MTNPPIHHQSANPSPICQSITNPPIKCQSITNLPIKCQSITNPPVQCQSWTDGSIHCFDKLTNKYIPISCQFSVNLPIHYQSVNPTPIGQSNVNIDESTHLAILAQRPHEDDQARPPIRGNHKKWTDTGSTCIGTNLPILHQSEATCVKGRGTSVL